MSIKATEQRFRVLIGPSKSGSGRKVNREHACFVRLHLGMILPPTKESWRLDLHNE